MTHISIEKKDSPSHQMIASPSTATGDLTSYFSNSFKYRDLEDAAESLFNASLSSWDSTNSSEDGWPIHIAFRVLNDSLDMLWNGVFVKSWTEFATNSDLIFVLSHNLRNDESVLLYDIAIDRECGNYTVINTTIKPTSTSTAGNGQESQSRVTIDPLFDDSDGVTMSISDDVSLNLNATKWILNATATDQWYVISAVFKR